MGFISIPPHIQIEFKRSLVHNLVIVAGLLREANRLEGVSDWIQNTAGRFQNQNQHATVFDGITNITMIAHGVIGYLVDNLDKGEAATSFPHMMDQLDLINGQELQRAGIESVVGLAQRLGIVAANVPYPQTPAELLTIIQAIQNYRETYWGSEPLPMPLEDFAELLFQPETLHEHFMLAFEYLWHYFYAPRYLEDSAHEQDAVIYHRAQNYPGDIYGLFRAVTGRSVPPMIADYLPNVRHVTLIPTSHIGSYIIFSILKDRIWIGFNANLVPAERVESALTVNIAELYTVLNALADEVRLKIVIYLRQHGEQNVGEIAEAMHLTISTTSRHLKMLARVGVLDQRPDATMRYYALNPHVLAQVGNHLQALALGEKEIS